MNLTLHWKASIWYHNCSVCTSTYALYLSQLELYNLLSNLKIKPNIIGISETKCNRVKGYGIIYPNDVIERLIYNIKNVRIAKNSTFQCHLFALLHLLLGKKCNRVKGHGMI